MSLDDSDSDCVCASSATPTNAKLQQPRRRIIQLMNEQLVRARFRNHSLDPDDNCRGTRFIQKCLWLTLGLLLFLSILVVLLVAGMVIYGDACNFRYRGS